MEYKQEMPPAGGFSPITYKRIPLKEGLGPKFKLGVLILISGLSWIFFKQTKDRMNNEAIEMRCARLALTPMIQAEVDRMQLKQLKRNRDAEERIMKDVEGWEVGKWEHSPVFLTLGPDYFFKPIAEEFYAHADPELLKKSHRVISEN